MNVQYVCSPEKGGAIWQEIENKFYFWDKVPEIKSVSFEEILNLTQIQVKIEK